MKNKIILIFFTIIALQVKAQNSDTIYWSSSHKLKFDDFQGASDTTKIDLANSHIGIWYIYNVVNNKLQFKVSCFFLKKKSWIKYDMNTIVEHEQIHFDIAKLFALKLEKKLQQCEITPSLDIDLKIIYNNIVTERLAMDNLFDATIKGAKDDSCQKKFMLTVKKEINAYKTR